MAMMTAGDGLGDVETTDVNIGIRIGKHRIGGKNRFEYERAWALSDWGEQCCR